MAAVPINKRFDSNVPVTKLDLAGGPHSFTYQKREQVLHVHNVSEVGDVTVNLLGDTQSSWPSPGVEPKDVSAGYDFVVATGAEEALVLDDFRGYLGNPGNNVTVTVTGATGVSFGWITER